MSLRDLLENLALLEGGTAKTAERGMPTGPPCPRAAIENSEPLGKATAKRPPPARKRKGEAEPGHPEWHDLEGWRALLRACRDRKARQGVVRRWAALFPGVAIDGDGAAALPEDGLPPCDAVDALRSAVAYHGLAPAPPREGPPGRRAAPAGIEERAGRLVTAVFDDRNAPAATIVTTGRARQVVWEHARLRQVGLVEVPGGERFVAVTRHPGGGFTRGPGAPLLIALGRAPVTVPKNVKGPELWERLAHGLRERQPVLRWLEPAAFPPSPAEDEEPEPFTLDNGGEPA